MADKGMNVLQTVKINQIQQRERKTRLEQPRE